MTRGTPEQHHRANNEIYIGLRNIQDASSLGLLAFEHARKIRFCFTEQDEVGTSLPFDNWGQWLRGIEIHTMLEKWKSTTESSQMIPLYRDQLLAKQKYVWVHTDR